MTLPSSGIKTRRDKGRTSAAGQELAAAIPGAEFVQVDSPNHILLESEPAWERFKEVVLDFTGVKSQAENEIFDSLSPRDIGFRY